MHMFGLVSPTPRGKNLFPGSVQPKPCVDVAAGLDVSVGFAVGGGFAVDGGFAASWGQGAGGLGFGVWSGC